jgi:hypothetical protein
MADAGRRTCNEVVLPWNKCKFSILASVPNVVRVCGKKVNTLETRRTRRPDLEKLRLNVDASYHEEMRVGAI